jgi:hypothetical protein
MNEETDNRKPEAERRLAPVSLLGALVQISKAHAEDDEICVSIVQEPGVHIRVSLTPQNFADTLCTGRKVEARVVRWRIAPNVPDQRPGD